MLLKTRYSMSISMRYLMFSAYIYILLSGISYAGDFVYKYSLPENSTMKFSLLKGFGNFATFAGDTVIKAKYKFIYAEVTDNAENPYLLIMPDRDSVKKLPFLTQWNEPDYANEILILNADKVAHRLLGSEMASKLKKGIYPEISGEAEFVLTRLAAGYECDTLSFIGYVK